LPPTHFHACSARPRVAREALSARPTLPRTRPTLLAPHVHLIGWREQPVPLNKAAANVRAGWCPASKTGARKHNQRVQSAVQSCCRWINHRMGYPQRCRPPSPLCGPGDDVGAGRGSNGAAARYCAIRDQRWGGRLSKKAARRGWPRCSMRWQPLAGAGSGLRHAHPRLRRPAHVHTPTRSTALGAARFGVSHTCASFLLSICEAFVSCLSCSHRQSLRRSVGLPAARQDADTKIRVCIRPA